ncbi:hypothetical protein FF36_03761 [Frankia torreyi]|uniref:Lipoprotein n=1 Tax=Frankia torreyi TaxID=1856 RepID=A0A0D8BC57_9ACTN|nr:MULTISPECIES: hypothetical protein [Frankia]KJE21858.1 hypothetical protein FF36_03761 [Frankia torreyi]KQC35872.1 hypothetical protein UK82_24295 [Frankia sp. ACN1ag]
MRLSSSDPRAAHWFARGLSLAGAVLCGVFFFGCGASGSTGSSAVSPAGSLATTGTAPAAASASAAATAKTAGTATGVAARTAAAATGAGATVLPAGASSGATAGARNLPVDAALREQLVAAWVAGHQGPDSASLSRSDVASTAAGSVYYAQETGPGTYWAVADFEPSASALAKGRKLNGAAGDPLIAFQDGPWLFTRPKGGSWKLAGDTGGQLCASSVPPAVAAVWNLPREGC